MQRTKIISTIGPASESLANLKKLVASGMDVARLNMSHNVYSHHQKLINNVRKVGVSFNRPITIIQDLQGPKIRIGKVDDKGVEVKKGERIILKTTTSHQKMRGFAGKEFPVQYKNFCKCTKPGQTIYIDDAMVELEVEKVFSNRVIARVKNNSVIKSNKGINIPGAKIDLKAITRKDIGDLEFGIKNRVDFIALSFVKTGKEIAELRKRIQILEKKYEHKYIDYKKPELKGKWSKISTRIIAKIETPDAVENFDKILEASDGIMIARGDLGLEMPLEDLPLIQKKLVDKCLFAAKPVIVATQMLNSMIENPVPTRAEVSDVANAILDGADAVMLSGETASGKYPVRAVKIMDDIAKKVELSEVHRIEEYEISSKYTTSAMAVTAKKLAEEVGAKAIICTTTAGFTARSISRLKPKQPIIALTPSELTMRQLNLNWGVYPYFFKQEKSFDKFLDNIKKLLLKEGVVRRGQRVVILISHPIGYLGESNLIKVETL